MSEIAHILVVDDDLEDRMILQDYFSDLELLEYVQFENNGQQALDFLDTIGIGALPQLIVLDLNMPILNGTQTLLKLKNSPRFKDIPVVIFSTSENEVEKRRCMNYGAINFLIKPTTYESGLNIVKYLKSLLKVNQIES